MALPRLFRTGSFRLAAAYLALFTFSGILLGAVMYFTVRKEAAGDIEERIDTETAALTRELKEFGRERLAALVSARDGGGGAFAYGLSDSSGALISGHLDPRNALGGAIENGWGRFRESDRDEAAAEGADLMLARATRLPDGSVLIVADDWDSVDRAGRHVLIAFGWALALTVVIGAAGGLALSLHALRRIEAIAAAARAIVGGNWRLRLPVGESNDELADLSRTFNGLFDRIEQLLLANKHAGEAIAHDLRKPLAGALRRLDSLEHAGNDQREAIIAATRAEIVSVLETFNALMRISQIEAGARRAGFRKLSLAEIARQLAEDFSPAAEEEGKSIACRFDDPFEIVGDQELLTQMIANCLDNAIRYTSTGAHIFIEGRRTGARGVLAVSDDGPGAPPEDLQRIFERFHRGDLARSTSGAGLGLALVAAVAELHGVTVRALDNAPGLRIEFEFSLSG